MKLILDRNTFYTMKVGLEITMKKAKAFLILIQGARRLFSNGGEPRMCYYSNTWDRFPYQTISQKVN